MYIYLTPSVGRNRAFVGGAEIRKLQEKTKTTMMTSYKYRLQNSRFFFLKFSKEIVRVHLYEHFHVQGKPRLELTVS